MRTQVFRLLVLGLIGMALLGGAAAAFAQSGAPVPAIINFAAEESIVQYGAVESDQATTTLSWHIVNVQAGQRVALDYAVQNGWVSVLSEGETLSPVGSREVTLRDPLNFGPPTFRLTLLSGRNIVDQRHLTLEYATNRALPAVESFTADVVQIDRASLGGRNTRVNVTWSVSNRQPLTNLVFEQLVSAGVYQTVELPRQFLYVPSFGSGPLQTIATAEPALTLRISVVNVITGDVYGQQSLVIPFTGEAAPAGDSAVPVPTAMSLPPVGEGDATAPETDPAAPAEGSEEGEASVTAPQINAFTINPTTAPAGSNVTIAWNVTGATTVQIQEIVAGSDTPSVTYVQLPLLGAVSVPLPANATTSVTYRLTATNDSGELTQSEIIVTTSGDAAG